MKLDLELQFENFTPMFDLAPNVTAAVACDVPVNHCKAFLAYIQAKPFGKEVIHRKVDSDNYTKTERVQAFIYDHYLVVVRTIGNTTKVFKFDAPTGLLLQEAAHITEVHQKMSTLHLI